MFLSQVNELKLKFSVFHIPLLGNALSVSVGECRRVSATFLFFCPWLVLSVSSRVGELVVGEYLLSASCHVGQLSVGELS